VPCEEVPSRRDAAETRNRDGCATSVRSPFARRKELNYAGMGFANWTTTMTRKRTINQPFALACLDFLFWSLLAALDREFPSSKGTIRRSGTRLNMRLKKRLRLEQAARPCRRGTYPLSASLAFVAQTGSLPCRRMASCRVSTVRVRVRPAGTLPISNRQYGRLPICATRTGGSPVLPIFWSEGEAWNVRIRLEPERTYNGRA
jgi:hypothetical protein